MTEESEVFSDDEGDEDIKSPSFILQNLDIAGLDCFDDDTCINAARIAAATIISQQICFYISLVLHGFKNRKIPTAPNILVYGGGFVGKRVIESLVDNRCGPMLYVYSRGDLRAKYWRSTGLRSSPSLNRLMKGEKADVVVILSGMSSFQVITKSLIPHVTRSTCLISSALGLERKRFFALMRTPAIFRTFLEAPSLVDQVVNNEELAHRLRGGRLDTEHGSIPPAKYEVNTSTNPEEIVNANGVTSGVGTSSTMNETRRGATMASSSGSPVAADRNAESTEESLHGTILDSLFSFRLDPQPLLQGTVEGSVEHAADLVAKRLRRMVDMISLTENYYAVLGIPHRKARAVALFSVLGLSSGMDTLDSQAPSSPGGGSVVSDMNSAVDQESQAGHDVIANILKNVQAVSYPVLINGIDTLEDTIACHFRRQFSKYIHVVDIPKVESLAEEGKPKVEERKKAKMQRMKTKGAGDTLALVTLMGGGGSREGDRGTGEGELRDDGANDADEEEKIKSMSHGIPIHNDNKLRKIFAYDMKLTGRAAAVADGVADDWTLDDDLTAVGSIASGITLAELNDSKKQEDDDNRSALTIDEYADYSNEISEVSTLPPRPDRPVALSVSDFPATLPTDPPLMMSNPVVSQQVEQDAEMKLLQFLEEEQIRKEQKENKMLQREN